MRQIASRATISPFSPLRDQDVAAASDGRGRQVYCSVVHPLFIGFASPPSCLIQWSPQAITESIRGILMKSKILVAFAATLALTACTTNPYTGQSQLSNTAGGGLLGAGGGAIAGALVGAAVGGDARVGALIGAGVGGLTGAAIGSYMDQQEAELRAQLQGTGVSVTRVGQNIVLNMPSNITFATDSSNVNPGFNSTLVSVALVLKKFDKSIVDVYGHTDNTGNPSYNLALSQRRAVSVATILANQGIDQRRFYIEGKGDTSPIASNATEAGRAQNRRVEIQIAPING
jgi:outer membrane protein OmpA-like peptidoglycan-associated protein